MAYADLKEHLGIESGDIYVYDTGQQLAYVEAPIRREFGFDVLALDRGMLVGWRDYVLPDGRPAKICADFRTEPDGEGGEYALDESGRRVSHRPATSFYFDGIYRPLAHVTSVAELDQYDAPILTDEWLSILQSEARRLSEETDYAIMGAFGGAFLEGGQGLRGWDKFMMDLAGDPAFADTLLDRLLEHYLRNVALYLDAVGDYIQIIQMGGDLGTQSGPQLRPRMYYEVIQPRQKALWGRIHALAPNVAIFLHSCGGIYEYIPGLIDAGLDVLNPVQISARGMDPARLKAEFGDRLCFWGGGCDTQQVLPFAAPEEVYAHTKHNIEILKPDGGFVFCQVHNIQAGVPPENITAMYEAVRDNWDY
jgi:uroporphyrinogen decarboxylase